MDKHKLGILDLFKHKNHDEENLSGKDVPRPNAREVRKPEALSFTPFVTEPVHLARGLTLLKGKGVSGKEFVSKSNSDLVPGVYEGGFKLWECAVDLVEAVRVEMQDGHLSFRGKRVLELGCGHGLPGILACVKGASEVHFQDFNDSVLINLTIPNVQANMMAAAEAVKAGKGEGTGGGGGGAGDLHPPLTPRSPSPSLSVRFFAGDWDDMDPLLSAAEKGDEVEGENSNQGVRATSDPQQSPRSISEASHLAAAPPPPPPPAAAAGNGVGGGQEGETVNEAQVEVGEADAAGARSSRKAVATLTVPPASSTSFDEPEVLTPRRLSSIPSFASRSVSGAGEEGIGGEEGRSARIMSLGRRTSGDFHGAWAGQADEGGYDVILTSETVYSHASMVKLLRVIKKCLRKPYGVVYLSGKKHYFGVGGGTRSFKHMVEEDGELRWHLLREYADGASNVREIWKFFYKNHGSAGHQKHHSEQHTA